jgi:CHAT domain-containing protein
MTTDSQDTALRHVGLATATGTGFRPAYDASWAVVIGINNYSNGIRPLMYAVRDADGVARLLVEELGFAKERVLVVLDSPIAMEEPPYTVVAAQATKKIIERLLEDELPKKTGPDDRVLIFYAGHGERRPMPVGEPRGYLVPADAHAGEWHTYIKMDDVLDAGDLCRAKHVFYLLDACYSGLAFSRANVEPSPYAATMLTNRTRMALTAGTAQEAVNDKGPGGHSPFTWYVLQGLRGEAAQRATGVVTGSDLMLYVRNAVGQHFGAQQTPDFGKLPGHESGGDFIFRLPAEQPAAQALSRSKDTDSIGRWLVPLVQSPPDLEMFVLTSGDGGRLSFFLHAAGTKFYDLAPMGEMTIADPRSVLGAINLRLGELERVSQKTRSPSETAAATREMADAGAELYTMLFPESFKQAYRSIRETYRGRTLMITSDAHWIPWELVRPWYADQAGNLLYDDDFLGERFILSRRLPGGLAPDALAIAKGALVFPENTGLYDAQQEIKYLRSLEAAAPGLKLTGPIGSLAEVQSVLGRGEYQFFHFVGHSHFDIENPFDSPFRLADGTFEPYRIVGPRQAGLRRSRPLVFLHASSSGRVGSVSTGPGGWATVFLDSGASAFIGALGELNDSLANQFVPEFYDRLFGVGAFAGQRMPLGQAFHQARLAVRQTDPANPTWLFYTLWGNPNCRVFINEEERPQQLEGQTKTEPAVASQLPASSLPLAVTSRPPTRLKDLARLLQDPELAPALELFVLKGEDGRSLEYYLHSAQEGDFDSTYLGDVPLYGKPVEMFERVYEMLDKEAPIASKNRTQPQFESFAQAIADIGAYLYTTWLPEAFKHAYVRFRDKYQGLTLVITSDAHWMPWELFRPTYVDWAGSLLYDDEFLCQRFMLSRRLPGVGTPDRLKITRAPLVVSSGGPGASEESAYIGELQQRCLLRADEATGPLIDQAEVLEMLVKGDRQLLHFACQGAFDDREPDESRVKLRDGSLRPNQIVGLRQAGIRRSKPLVFMNSVRSGRVGTVGPALGGWPPRFLNAGASAFIGSLGEINDKLAVRFAQELYDRFLGIGAFEGRSQPLGQAFREARIVVRDLDPANPTWLLYTLYGNPDCRAVLGDGEQHNADR